MYQRRAFTLIELLVVISIITLLIAIMSPALGRAKYRMRVTECMVNMRSQWQAQTNLADDNMGKFWRHNDESADYARTNGASDSLWHAITRGNYLSEYTVTICPVMKAYPSPSTADRYLSSSWNGGDFAGWDTDKPFILSTYLWLANFQKGNGTQSSGVATIYQSPNGQPEPAWPTNMSSASSNRAFITHRVSGGAGGGFYSHDLGHSGLGLSINAADLLKYTTDQPLGFADGHVISRPRAEIRERSLIYTSGIGYYYY